MPISMPMYDNYGYNYPYYGQNQQYPYMYQPKQNAINSGFMLNGKVVDSLEVVKAMDIPMDGQSYYFPKADGTEIYCKKWNANGTTSIVAYKPILDSFADNSDNLSQSDIKGQIQALQSVTDSITKHIDDRFDKLEKNFQNTKRNIIKSKECDAE